MLGYRLKIKMGYYEMSLLFDNFEELDVLVRNILAHKENGEDKVKIEIEIVTEPEKVEADKVEDTEDTKVEDTYETETEETEE